MINSLDEARAAIGGGRQFAYMADFSAPGKFWWVTVDTNKIVSRSIVKNLLRREELRVVARDFAGEPIQVGAHAAEVLGRVADRIAHRPRA